MDITEKHCIKCDASYGTWLNNLQVIKILKVTVLSTLFLCVLKVRDLHLHLPLKWLKSNCSSKINTSEFCLETELSTTATVLLIVLCCEDFLSLWQFPAIVQDFVAWLRINGINYKVTNVNLDITTKLFVVNDVVCLAMYLLHS